MRNAGTAIAPAAGSCLARNAAAATVAPAHAIGAARRVNPLIGDGSPSSIRPWYDVWRCGLAVSPPRWTAMLQVQALSVEVGGRQIVDGASFTVMPRDKVGLVGRNGAGKTTLFRVLGGALEHDRRQGRCARAGSATCRRTRASPACSTDAPPSPTCCPAAASTRSSMRIEKLRIAMEEDASERNVGRYSRAQDEFATSGGYAAESEARSMAAGLGLPGDRLELPIGVLSRWRAATRRARRASCSPAATCCCSTSPPTTSTSTPRCGCCSSCARTAARCW